MDANEFINKLVSVYTKDVNDATIAEIQDWMFNKNISEDFIGKLYKKIIEDYPYRTFPSFAYIVKMSQQVYADMRKNSIGNNKNIWRAEKEFINIDPFEILRLLQMIDAKYLESFKNDNIELTTKENHVYCTFQSMLNDYRFMKEKNWGEQSIFNRLVYLRDKICKYQDVAELQDTYEEPVKDIDDLVKSFMEGKVLERSNPDYFQD